ncbi:MAG: gliding motility protein GldN [Chitinophagaceae bacterium]|nr:gliding motility protein GldN [Chitinophagaceae bacterium]
MIQLKTVMLASMFVSSVAVGQVGGPPAGTTPTDPAVAGGVAEIVKESYKPSLRKDGAIDKVEHNNYVVPWQNIREADVLYKKRVWREIDTRQRQNVCMRYPGDDESGGGMYIEILIDAIRKGNIVAFSDERFTIPLSPEDVMTKIAGKSDTNTVVDPVTGEEKQVITVRRFDPETITKFRIKEDWIFDKNEGRMKTRIIGIAPYQDRFSDVDGSFRGSVPLFWLYYPDARGVHVKYEVYNPDNDVYRITWDDYFEKRFFASYVIKSNINNPLQDDIKAFKKGVDALNASEEIKEKLFNKEHDLWVY